MRIVESYSHLNGHEWLTVHQPNLISEQCRGAGPSVGTENVVADLAFWRLAAPAGAVGGVRCGRRRILGVCCGRTPIGLWCR